MDDILYAKEKREKSSASASLATVERPELERTARSRNPRHR